ncbi:MAG: protein kinase domain-containing protein, partial [bacterium]
MGKYSCFNCPEKGHDDTRELDQECPKCGHRYGFPLFSPPKTIGKYEVVDKISRGFYGSVYLVEDKLLNKKNVVKIIPKSIYNLHNKDFYEESRDHAALAAESPFIVDIITVEEASVIFGNGIEIDCYVSVLKYIPGKTLKQILLETDGISAIKTAQIAIDLFQILDVLRKKKKNHNDLHSENIIVQQLDYSDRRAGAIESQIRAVAIDIGSLTSVNKEGDSPDRIGDVHWVADYLKQLSGKLLEDPDKVSDQDYRLASLLNDRAKLLFPTGEFQRIPNFEEIVESIKNSFHQQAFPWEEPLRLLNFNDTYNAQTLDPWYVPTLLVDPDNQWLDKISGKGPLVVTGMRGCGKTMILRAAQFHARAAFIKLETKNNVEKQKIFFREEPFIGLYVSCKVLLDRMGRPVKDLIHQPYSRLFIWYGIEAIKALRHLNSISEELVNYNYHKELVSFYKEHLTDSDLLDNVHGELQLEQRLLSMTFSLEKGEDRYIVKSNPANAFSSLAQKIRSFSKIWHNHYILFLLDDVSTRYLSENNIRELLSSLIFQSNECAFKITSEVQTIELVLFSPGMVEKAKKGRDFETFDLGSAVNQKIRNKGGKQFVSEILLRRANSHPKHPAEVHPNEMLGDISLTKIAENIVKRGKDKTLRKQIYHGLTALCGVCVGDIGDIINLYDMIIGHYDHEKKQFPIAPAKQNECFQDLCSVRLHEINFKGKEYKDHALSFAQASYDLLMKSFKNGDNRLRQYYSIYVRITTGNMEEQYQKIRELLDAGIFVYSGDPLTPRTLGIDTNPINQFKLTFRKLYGISNLIGLTNGDRFEISGEKLEKWLNEPENGKELLINSVGGTSSNIDEGDDEELNQSYMSTCNEPEEEVDSVQTKLSFEYVESSEPIESIGKDRLINEKIPLSQKLSFEKLSKVRFDLFVAALGFEERTIESFRKLINLDISKLLLIKYNEEGKSKEIIDLVKSMNIDYEIVDYENVLTSIDIPNGKILCDITGMSKSIIFNVIRNTLKINGFLWFSHTYAQTYFPLNNEISSALEKYKKEDSFSKLDLITNNVNKGEDGPYEVYDLLFSDTDESKRNILIGNSTPKYEKLFKVLEYRTVDKVCIITPDSDTPRAILANLASDLIVKTFPNAEVTKFDSNEIDGILSFLTTQYQKYFIDQNFNFEIALSGSKRNTV